MELVKLFTRVFVLALCASVQCAAGPILLGLAGSAYFSTSLLVSVDPSTSKCIPIANVFSQGLPLCGFAVDEKRATVFICTFKSLANTTRILTSYSLKGQKLHSRELGDALSVETLVFADDTLYGVVIGEKDSVYSIAKISDDFAQIAPVASLDVSSIATVLGEYIETANIIFLEVYREGMPFIATFDVRSKRILAIVPAVADLSMFTVNLRNISLMSLTQLPPSSDLALFSTDLVNGNSRLLKTITNSQVEGVASAFDNASGLYYAVINDNNLLPRLLTYNVDTNMLTKKPIACSSGVLPAFPFAMRLVRQLESSEIETH